MRDADVVQRAVAGGDEAEHEGPSRRLVEVATRVAMLRGSRIVSFGAADLVRRDVAALACTGEVDFRRRVRQR